VCGGGDGECLYDMGGFFVVLLVYFKFHVR